MIQILSLRYTKSIAAILFLCFYTGMLSPLYAAMKEHSNRSSIVNNVPVLKEAGIIRPALPASVKSTEASVVAKPIEQPLAEASVEESIPDFIGGPSQPEMNSFKSVGTNDMVNLFTGDFSYNIPLLDVGGYPVNIFYNGGITMEQEAGWVGLGWNINPGAITRNMRGVPDDFDGSEKLVQKQNTKPNVTWGGRFGGDWELIGIKMPYDLDVNLGYSYNNYLGPSLDVGIKGGTNFKLGEFAASEKNSSIGASLNLSASADLSSRSGLTLNPNISLNANLSRKDKVIGWGIGASTSYNARSGIKSLHLYEQMSYSYMQRKKSEDEKSPILNRGRVGASGRSVSISFAKPSYIPAIRMPITNSSETGSFQLGKAISGSSVTMEVEVYKQESKIALEDRIQQKPMVGYIYAHKAMNNSDAVMDFTRFNDKEVTSKTKIISVPQYAYDVFSISGEGTGGSIRAYRTDNGYVRDNKVHSKDGSKSLGLDLGLMGVAPSHVGANFNTVSTPTTSGDWEQGNLLKLAMPFTEKSQLQEHVYFRNPGETSVLNEDQYKTIGGTDLVRFKLGGTKRNPEVHPILEKFNNEGKKIGEQNIKEVLPPAASERNKRTQVVSFLTASEAKSVGLDSMLKSYNAAAPIAGDTLRYTPMERIDSYRRPHHISEFNVLEADGRKYVYGLPVYNLVQKDYTVTVDATADANELVTVTTSEMNIDNTSFPSNKDGYKLITETPAYAHSFLLTGLLSPDYVDITGNGITEDDLGSAIKYNYTKIAKTHKWRTPSTNSTPIKAHFNDGNMTEVRDNKGVISYGERESWYLHSIESKTMIAFFELDNRKDAKGVSSETGIMDSTDTSVKRLKKIDLYNKADIRKNGKTNAKPIKTVWFEYDYSLCKNAAGNNGINEVVNGNNVNANKGKLTLKSIYFTYNGQQRAHKDRYVFGYMDTLSYRPDSSVSYEVNASDRWGNYKPKDQNPNSLKNSIFPYAKQNEPEKIHANAAVWNLNSILLPSGGQLTVEYESDDYAYVQNRRATAMMPIANLGRVDNNNTGGRLYDIGFGGMVIDNDRVYITVTEPCTTKEQVLSKYLSGIKQLAFKLAVNMPKGKEYIVMYASIVDYGFVSDQTKIWVQLEKVDGYSPLSLTAIEYLREHLPGQAYEGYSPEGSGLEKVGKMLKGMLDGLGEAFKKPVDFLRSKGKAASIVLSESFVRLNVPPGKSKYGGGNRVKSVTIKDNWKKMTGQYTSVYGQQYDYTTTEVINGVPTVISSGVASYEPSIGGEENPFQEILKIANRLPLGPATYDAIEMPVLDAFFPAPLVGYSKVTVRSIKSGTLPPNGKKNRSGTGKQVTEFHTAKEFPVYYDYTAIDPSGDMQDHRNDYGLFFEKSSFDSRAISQGFRVIINDMHGKMKTQSSFAETDSTSLIGYTKYYYSNTGNKGLTEKFDFVHQSLGGQIKPGNMGIDIELMTDTREFIVKTSSLNIQAQVDWMIPFFPISWIPFIWRTVGKSENYYRAVTTTKVINYHSIVDSVVVMDKGSAVATRNLLYDAETGTVLVSRANNEFDKPIYQTSYPAYWAYSGMGLAYKNIDARWSGVNFADGKITSGISTADQKKTFESGDELFILTGNKPDAGCAAQLISEQVKKIWVMDKMKNNSSLTNPNPDFIFIDEKGVPYTRNNVSFRIIRSGKRNMLAAQAHSFTSLSYPDTLIGGTRRLGFASTATVLNSSAMEYKEKWQVDKDVIKRMRMEPIPPLPAGTNIIVNGNFSSGNTGFTSPGYTYYPSSYTSGNGRYTIRTNSGGWIPSTASCSDKTTGTGNMMVIDGQTVYNSVFWSQVVSVEKDREYQFSLWAQTIHTTSPAQIKLLINGVQIGNSFNLTSTTCLWQNFSVRWKSLGVTSATISLIDINTAATGNDFAIDDISFHALAKPSCDEVEIEDCAGYLEKQINPYRKGLLGTFRSHKNRVFYGERMQGQTLIDTDTRINTDGALKGFVPYWSLNTSNNLTASIDTVKWVWNSEVTGFNSRGLELETKDALGIYTAAQYGYAKNLPVAIANNAKYNEMAYNGFEDVDYTESLNKASGTSCIANEHFYFNKAAVVSDNVAGFNAHSGRNMIRVPVNSNINMPFKVESATDAFILSHTRDTIKSLSNVGGNLEYYTVSPNQTTGFPGFDNMVNNSLQFFGGVGANFTINITDTFIYPPMSPYPIRQHSFSLRAHQYMDISEPNMYNLGAYIHSSNYAIGSGRTLMANVQVYRETGEFVAAVYVDAGVTGGNTNSTVYLCKGKYKVSFFISDEMYHEEAINPNIQIYNPIDFSYSINSSSQTYKSLTTQNGCAYTKPLNGSESMLNPVFQIPSDKKMLLSTWVRETCATTPCTKTNYTDGKVQLVFRNSSGGIISTSAPFAPEGPIIEGWQKIEGSFTAPPGAVTMELRLVNSSSSQPVYFDDIRIHPYNANMKSYVYDPVNLRLMAELDANNYATFYEYDEEGGLIRTKVETEQGVKTINETRSTNQKSVTTPQYN